MAVELIAHASSSSAESRLADFNAVLESLESSNPADRVFAIKQISIWLMQKSQQAQDFVDQGHMGLIVDSLRPDDDTPSSSTAPDVSFPAACLLHDFAKEGKKCQDAIAASGGVAILLDLLPPEDAADADLDHAIEAVSALCLLAVGSEESRKEILLAGGLPALIRCLDARNAIRLRAEAAGAILGLATERKERQAAILEADGMRPLIELLNGGSDAEEEDRGTQLAALNAAAALRRLCDAAAATAAFCQTGGLETLVSRIVDDEPADRLPLRLPMPLAPSTVRAECKQLLGDVYVGSDPVYQEKIVQVLERHNITIDRITTTPTASEQTLEGKDSMERGHKVLSCRTSMPTVKVPEIKLHLKRALKPRPGKTALNITKEAIAVDANAQTQPIGRPNTTHDKKKTKRKRRPLAPLRRLFAAFNCISPNP